jgi:hypothetical protein
MKVAGVLHVDRRSAKRYGVVLRVMFGWNGRIIEGQTVDLSETGLRLHTEVELPTGTELLAYFGVPGDLVTHRIDSVVVWSRPSEEVLGWNESGLRFKALSPDVIKAIRATLVSMGSQPPPSSPPPPDEIPELSSEDVVEVETTIAAKAAVQAAAPLPAPARAPAAPLPAPARAPAAEIKPWGDDQAIGAAVSNDTRRMEESRRKANGLLLDARRVVREGKLDEAARMLAAAITASPDSPDLVEEFAQVEYLRGRVVEAATLFDKALRLRQERGGG